MYYKAAAGLFLLTYWVQPLTKQAFYPSRFWPGLEPEAEICHS